MSGVRLTVFPRALGLGHITEQSNCFLVIGLVFRLGGKSSHAIVLRWTICAPSNRMFR